MQEAKLITTHYELELKELILKAEKYIYILMFRFDYAKGWRGQKTNQIIQALYFVKRENVDVRIILHKGDPPKKSDFRNIQTAKLLIASGIPVRWYPRTTSMHAKLAVSDDVNILCGSHNLTASALWQNIEASILLRKPYIAMKAKNYFLNLWNESRGFE